jgi:hypothetical protein
VIDPNSNSSPQNNGPMNPFLNEIFHILYPIYVTSQNKISVGEQNDSMCQSEDGHGDAQGQGEMDGYLYYIFGIVVRDIRLFSRSAIGDIIHEMKSLNHQIVSTVPHAYDLLFKSVELAPHNW